MRIGRQGEKGSKSAKGVERPQRKKKRRRSHVRRRGPPGSYRKGKNKEGTEESCGEKKGPVAGAGGSAFLGCGRRGIVTNAKRH